MGLRQLAGRVRGGGWVWQSSGGLKKQEKFWLYQSPRPKENTGTNGMFCHTKTHFVLRNQKDVFAGLIHHLQARFVLLPIRQDSGVAGPKPAKLKPSHTDHKFRAK
jgi:hypothetical protein